MPTVRAGKLRHRVVIQRHNGAQNSYGEQEDRAESGWADLIQVWAEAEPPTGTDRFDASRERTDQPYLVRMRRDPRFTVTAADRLRWDGRTLDIDAPPADIGGARRLLELSAVEHG